MQPSSSHPKFCLFTRKRVALCSSFNFIWRLLCILQKQGVLPAGTVVTALLISDLASMPPSSFQSTQELESISWMPEWLWRWTGEVAEGKSLPLDEVCAPSIRSYTKKSKHSNPLFSISSSRPIIITRNTVFSLVWSPLILSNIKFQQIPEWIGLALFLELCEAQLCWTIEKERQSK